jgi:hypothetical protein
MHTVTQASDKTLYLTRLQNVKLALQTLGLNIEVEQEKDIITLWDDGTQFDFSGAKICSRLKRLALSGVMGDEAHQFWGLVEDLAI